MGGLIVTKALSKNYIILGLGPAIRPLSVSHPVPRHIYLQAGGGLFPVFLAL